MPAALKDIKPTPGQLLIPISLIAGTLFVFLAFQTSQILLEREALHAAKSQQDKPLEEMNKVQAQFTALALGANKLAKDGNKPAASIVERLKQVGVVFEAPPADTGAAPAQAAPAPAAEPAAPTPAKKKASAAPASGTAMPSPPPAE